MKKMLFFACLAMAALVGCGDDPKPVTPDPDPDKKPDKVPPAEEVVPVKIVGDFTDGGFVYAEGSGTPVFLRKSFVDGDKAGMFIVKDGSVVEPNMPLTYDGSKWNGDEIVWEEGMVCHVYMPYQEDAVVVDKVDATAADADGFFAPLTDVWQPSSDQSDFAGSVVAADMMIATATVSEEAEGVLNLTADMEHILALAVWELPGGTRYTTSDGFRYSAPSDVSGFAYTMNSGAVTPGTFNGMPCFIYNPASVASIDVSYTAGGETHEFSIPLSGKRGTVANTVIGGGRQDGGTRDIRIGDLFYCDGSILPVEVAAELPDGGAMPGVAGVVFQTDIDRISLAEKEFLGEVHALVVAAKVADPELLFWYCKSQDDWTRDEGEEDPAFPGMVLPYIFDTDYIKCYELCDADIDGYFYSEVIRIRRENDVATGLYPAFQAAFDFGNEVNVSGSSVNTTTWYMPSVGQWHDIFRGLGNVTLDTGDGFESIGDGDFRWIGRTGLFASLNASLSKIPDDEKTLFNIWDGYWSSSQVSADNARCFYFYSEEIINNALYSKKGANYVRCVLAF